MSLRPWKNAASLMLVARMCENSVCNQNRQPNAADEWELLMLQRSARSKFMAKAFVFPGGVSDESDFDVNWRTYCHREEQHFQEILKSAPKLPMYQETQDRGFPGPLGFRITALRETFEEAGILLCRTADGESLEGGFLLGSQLIDWQKKIAKNPSLFLQLHQLLGVFPDLRRLQQWTNWLTPTDLGESMRYDTVFFITTLPEGRFHFSIDEKEIKHGIWDCPGVFMEKYRAQELWLAPPQIYELTRLPRTWKKLLQFLNAFDGFSVIRWLPVRVDCPEGVGIVSLLPGDDLYPLDPDVTGEKGEKGKPNWEPNVHTQHRLIIRGLYDCQVVSRDLSSPLKDPQTEAKL